ncbi:Flightless-I protein homolog, putative [Brugia malayi]|uniref:BMA-FLI-1 n=1 Tax=Brugia malayi TaxID=6279 RepID=A0A1I9GC95_BRUMA|nr:Flightless-I protein homolog, putative [Brugia malayi]CRZ22138.1 BMA-FLI-1 [Brugia malayi]VIO90379.1 Flightless-I protein homolog, putative [Brugia malayi]
MSTGVLPFVKGIDFSYNDFSGDCFPVEVEQMTQMTWLKLNHACLERVPDELSRLTNLEHLQMTCNTLSSVHGELSDLPRLRSVIVRHNQIKTSGIPTDIFRMKDLTIIDFSHNTLREVPPNLEYAKCAIVLNLSHNNIENIPNAVFSNLIDLLYLDLSNNKLEMLPPQIRRLTTLQVLRLSNNPLHHFQLKQLPSMKALRVLHMRNTSRTLENIPPTLDDLDNLQDVDFSHNNLPEVPDCLYKLKKLRKLDISHNQIKKIESKETPWENLETLNVSSNQLKVLPESIVRMVKLQRLYASDNQLTFEGIPSGIGKLVQLQVLYLSYNQLELIPEGVSRCVRLHRLKLDNNKLITLPDSIHLLPDLKQLDLHNNDGLVLPPKPNEENRSLAFYNVDFSLANQMKLAGQSPSSSVSSVPSSATQKDPVARKKEFLRRRRMQADSQGANKVIEGMSHIAGAARDQLEHELPTDYVKVPTWKDKMEQQKPHLDYSEVFDEDVGQDEGIWVWEIENFYPSILDSSMHGHFYDADCYLILRTRREESGSLKHSIFYWIGENSSLDKGMCAAVHAVNLRNHLGATCRTEREEMNDESDDFLELFGEEITYIEGARTASGFYTVEKAAHVTRFYRVSVAGNTIEMEPVPVSPDSLDPRYVFLLDAGDTIWIWSGRKARITVSNKARLFAVKMNKKDRKGRAEIESCAELRTPEGFWMALYGQPNKPEDPIVEHVDADFVPERRRLYQVQIGMGFLELPQIELKHSVLKQDMLDTKCAYILDCTSDIFLWVGRKANRLVKMAGQKMVVELHAMLERPNYTIISRETEGEESTIFRSKFQGWDDIIPFDFTRTADSVQRRGADLKIIMERDKIKTDLAPLFLPRQSAMSEEEANQMMEECNEDLELLEPFVLEGKKFVRLPQEELGTFYTMDCYVFLCRYEVIPEEDETDLDEEEIELSGEKNDAAGDDTDTIQIFKRKEPEEVQEDFKCVVYFWQGRDANNMGWLHFTFSLQKKFEGLFKDKLEVVRMYQQQENHKFLSHFHKKFVIRRGRRGLTMNLGGHWPELFLMRANGSAVCTRTIQIDCRANQLNSAFCFILRAPFKIVDENGLEGKVFVWYGSKSNPNHHDLCLQVANELINRNSEFPVEIVREGDEPEKFWECLGGKKKYDTNGDFLNFTRLFRCTNEKGYFVVSEKTVDFCQDDLDDDDIMILDNGDLVFLWMGYHASEVELKLAYKAAQVYVAHMKIKEPERPRKLVLSLKGRESRRFTKCFHAWGKHKIPAGDEV